MNLPDTPRASSRAVLCVGGGMVHTDRDDLTVVDRAFFYPGQMVVSALDPGGQVGVVTGVDRVVDLVDSNSDKVVVARAVSPSWLHRVMS
jgi:ubiquitin-conjugating enzyme E2 O